MLLRICALIIHCLYGLLLCIFMKHFSVQRQEQMTRQWHLKVLRIFKVKVSVKGTLASGKDLVAPCLIAANQISSDLCCKV
jgi:hypothetical protein